MVDDNGLTSFDLHVEDLIDGPAALGEDDAITAEVTSLRPEVAARRYLELAVDSPRIPSIKITDAGDANDEFKLIGTETVPLTDTQIVKFAQYHNEIPLFGSSVAVEMNMDNSFVSLVAESPRERPGDDPGMVITSDKAKQACLDDAGADADDLKEGPTKQYFYDASRQTDKWRLVYVQPNVPFAAQDSESVPAVFDYIVDAQTGDIVTKLPRSHSASPTVTEVDIEDGLGNRRTLRVLEEASGNLVLVDPDRQVQTFDFGFRDVFAQKAALPGGQCAQPPQWSGGAISAHANAADVADFVKEILRRDGLDGKNGSYVSSINCVQINVLSPGAHPHLWRNAAWLGDRGQMVYGQHLTENGDLRSYALAKDVVAHEMAHGLIQFTAGLKYQGQSGALNESYADIFGIIISNFGTDVADWNWEMGEDADGTGLPLRDISDPPRFGDPDHMSDYHDLPLDRQHDWGGVHTNSGIHNKAGYNLLTSTIDGSPVFEPAEVAQLLYLALLKMNETSTFMDSRNRVEGAAKSLYRSADPEVKTRTRQAVAEAFAAVGIE
jgi:Zn-dependent metalloprotease